MVEMAQDQTNDAVWHRLDEHGRAINKIQMDTAINASDISNLKSQNMDIFGQITATRSEIMQVVSTTNKNVEGLKEKDLLREGAKSQWKLMAAILGSFYTILQIGMIAALIFTRTPQ